MKKPLVIIVGGGAVQLPMIDEAHALGMAVGVTDRNVDCPGKSAADAFWQIDTSDVRGHVQLGMAMGTQTAWDLRGVVTAGADVAPSVAACAEGAGRPGIPLAVARLTHDKRGVRQALEEAALTVYSPRWIYIDRDDSWDEVVRYIETEPGWPCIVKPLSERASRGVTIVQSAEYLTRALERGFVYSNACLVEALLTGSEHSTEVIFGNDGEVLFFNIVDRYFDYSSNVPIEKGHINPTRLDDHTQQEIFFMVLAAARVLGVTWGPFKIDCILTKDGPKILECSARLSGGYDSTWTCPATNRHPTRLLLQLACGLQCEPDRLIRDADGYAASVAILQTKTGTLAEIVVPPWAGWGDPDEEGAACGEILMSVHPGGTVLPLDHNANRCGFVNVHGTEYWPTWMAAERAALAIASTMRIRP